MSPPFGLFLSLYPYYSQTLHPGKKTWKLRDWKTHVVNHKTSHALYIPQHPNPPTPAPYLLQTHKHREEKSYLRGDTETMGQEEGTSGSNLSRLRPGVKTKIMGGLWKGSGGGKKEGDCRLPEQCQPILWLRGAAPGTKQNLSQE